MMARSCTVQLSPSTASRCAAHGPRLFSFVHNFSLSSSLSFTKLPLCLFVHLFLFIFLFYFFFWKLLFFLSLRLKANYFDSYVWISCFQKILHTVEPEHLPRLSEDVSRPNNMTRTKFWVSTITFSPQLRNHTTYVPTGYEVLSFQQWSRITGKLK